MPPYPCSPSLCASPRAAAVARRRPRRSDAGPATVTFTTTGWGHGKGLSQYGARNRANGRAELADDRAALLPGHARGAGPAATIRVLITADTTRTSWSGPQRAQGCARSARSKTWRLPAKVRGKKVARWRILPAGHRSKISFKTGALARLAHARKGDARVHRRRRSRSCCVTPAGRAAYRGALRSASINASGTPATPSTSLPLERLPARRRAAGGAGLVAGRTPSAPRRSPPAPTPPSSARAPQPAAYDLCDTAHCQVYGGVRRRAPARRRRRPGDRRARS